MIKQAFSAEEIPKQSTKGMVSPSAYRNVRGKRYTEGRIVRQKGTRNWRLGKVLPYPYCKRPEFALERTPRVWLENHLINRKRSEILWFNQLSQQDLGIEMVFYQQKYCQIRLKDRDKANWSKSLGLWGSTWRANRAISTCYPSVQRGRPWLRYQPPLSPQTQSTQALKARLPPPQSGRRPGLRGNKAGPSVGLEGQITKLMRIIYPWDLKSNGTSISWL